MSEELKPCPFCGGEAQIVGGADSGYAAYCPECIDGGHTEMGWYFTEADAIDSWNTRYDPIDDARIVEVSTSHIDIEQGEVITRFVPEQAATEQVEELKMRLALAAADSMGGAAFAALAVDELEQAIAATLGRPNAKSHPYGYERDTGAYDCTRCECGCINDISATYCNDCGGEIEIDESAGKEYYDGHGKHTVLAKKHDDGSLEFCERRYVPEDAATLGGGKLTAEQVMAIAGRHQPDYCSDTHVCFDWQAIAAELNATMGGGECEVIKSDNGLKCSHCGKELPYDPYADYEGNFCATCGARLRYGRR